MAERPTRLGSVLSLAARRPVVASILLFTALCFAAVGATRVDLTYDLSRLHSVGEEGESDENPYAKTVFVALERVALETPESGSADDLAGELRTLSGVAQVRVGRIPNELQGRVQSQVWAVLAEMAALQIGTADWELLAVRVADDPPADVVETIYTTVTQRIPEDHVAIVGLPVIEAAYEASTWRDNRRLFPLVFGLFALSLAFLFRSFWAVLVPMSAMLAASLLVLGLAGWLGVSLTGPMILLVPLVVVLGLADSVHLLRAYAEAVRQGEGRSEALNTALVTVGPACFWTTVTTSAGFLALISTQNGLLQTFGWMAASGIAMALLVTLTMPAVFLMAFRAKGQIASPKVLERIGHALARFGAWGRRRPRITIGALIGATLLLTLFSASNVRVDFKWGDELPASDRVTRFQGRFDEALGGLFPLELRLETRDGVERAAAYADLTTLVRMLQGEDSVGHVVSFVDAFEATASALRRNPDVLVGTNEDDPVRRQRTFMRYYQTAREAAHYAFAIPLFDPDNETYYVHVRLADVGVRAWADMLQRIERLDLQTLSEVSVEATGNVVVSVEGWRNVMPDLIRAIGLIALFSFVLLTLAFRSLRVGVVVLLPLALTISATLAVMAWWDIPLGYANLFVFTTALGVGVDAAIHLVSRFDQGDEGDQAEGGSELQSGYRATGTALLIGHGLLLVGLSALLLSDFRNITHAAGVLMVALTVNLIATLLAVPAGLRVRARRAGRRV